MRGQKEASPGTFASPRADSGCLWSEFFPHIFLSVYTAVLSIQSFFMCGFSLANSMHSLCLIVYPVLFSINSHLVH